MKKQLSIEISPLPISESFDSLDNKEADELDDMNPDIIFQMKPSFLPPTELEEIEHTARNFLDWPIPGLDFGLDVFEYNHEQLYGLLLGLLLRTRIHQLLEVNWIQLLEFLIEVQKGYLSNPYHCFRHACDVTYVLYYVLMELELKKYFTQIDIVVMLFSAILHDLAHPGLNNLYQINAKTDLAILYNDISVLENYSISQGNALLRKLRLLNNLSKKDQDYIFSRLQTIILSTDMIVHFELLQEYTKTISSLTTSPANSFESSEMNSPVPVTIQLPLSEENRLVLMKVLLHGADISNPARPWSVCQRWSQLVVEEFFLQGDTEKKNGLPISPNMDRLQSDQIQIALGFSDFIVFPYFQELSNFMPELQSLVNQLSENKKQLLQMQEEQKQSMISASTDSVYSESQDSIGQVSQKTEQYRQNMRGRRVSVAAGVLTIPDHYPSPPLSSKILARKFAFEFPKDLTSPSNKFYMNPKLSTAALHSPVTSYTNIRSPFTSGILSKMNQEMKLPMSRREEEQLKNKKRRNSTAEPNHEKIFYQTSSHSHYQLPVRKSDSTFSEPDWRPLVPKTSQSSLFHLQESIQQMQIHHTSSKSLKRSISSFSMKEQVKNSGSQILQERRLSKPQNVLHQLAKQQSAQIIQKMIDQSQSESQSSFSELKQLNLEGPPSASTLEDLHKTIHASNRLVQLLMTGKYSASSTSQDKQKDPLIHLLHAGLVQTRTPNASRTGTNSNSANSLDKKEKMKISISMPILFQELFEASPQAPSISQRNRTHSEFSYKKQK